MQKYGDSEEVENKRDTEIKELESVIGNAECFLLNRKFEVASRHALLGLRKISFPISVSMEEHKNFPSDPSLPHLQHTCFSSNIYDASSGSCLCSRLIYVFMQSRFEMDKRLIFLSV